jgi:hypothetical protein
MSMTTKAQEEDESDSLWDGKRRVTRMTRSRPGSPGISSPITQSATEKRYDDGDDDENIERRGKIVLTSGVPRSAQ